MLNKKLLGHNVRELRKKHALSGEKFGQNIGITKSALSQIEGGVITPSLELLNKMVHQYGSSLDLLVGRIAQNTENSDILFTSLKVQLSNIAQIDSPEPEKKITQFQVQGLTSGKYQALIERLAYLENRVVTLEQQLKKTSQSPYKKE